ncbi:methylenetetrahydrofolate reductase (NADPH)-like [Brevipalpus obovatus]|uniref:methylenetetrahydrofolate reductase (NADPH)-like n=1 Tax=Brevipalpus obovatus TaxID=246614 RepID=UPI003D9F615F
MADNMNLREKIMTYEKSSNGERKFFFSLEFFPPRNEVELEKFWPMLEKLRTEQKPLFWDVTWNTSRKHSIESPLSSMSVAIKAQNQFSHETTLHMTCIGNSEKELQENLEYAKKNGIRNILALRGDLPVVKKTNTSNSINNNNNDHAESDSNKNKEKSGDEECNLSHACDMVRFIKKNFGDYFTIIVAGYPDKHPESASFEDDLNYLKEKVQAGADIIITQLSLSIDSYCKFIRDCRAMGITVPIIPGIFLIQNKNALRNICKLTGVDPPESVQKEIERLSEDPEKLLKYGIDFATDLCQELIKSGLINGLHFYTMNKDDGVIEIIRRLNIFIQNLSNNNNNDIANQNVEEKKGASC